MTGIPIRPAEDRPNEKFTILGNENVRNSGAVKLTGLAMALHHYLISLPPGWQASIDQIAEDAFPLDSREEVRQASRELMNAGFLVLNRERGDRGRFRSWYQVFHNPQPEEVRTPSAGRLTGRRENGVRSHQGKREFPQVGPDAGRPAAGKAAGKDKTDYENSEKTTGAAGGCALPGGRSNTEAPEDQNRPPGRPSASAGRGEGPPKTYYVIRALTEVYGGTEDLSNEEMEDLYDYYVATAPTPVRSPIPYLVKLFRDTPKVSTLVGTAQGGLADPEDLAEQAKIQAQRDAILNGGGEGYGHCADCGGEFSSWQQVNEGGLCVWCVTDKRALAGQPR